MILRLKSLQPFAQGGNRLCFVHPDDPERCVKVRRPDFTLADRRRKKGFPKNLKPLSSFDDNREEAAVMAQMQRRYGEPVFRHVSHCYGFADTDMGAGLVSELIRDETGPISQTLKKYLWDLGLTPDCQKAVAELCRFWERLGVVSRDLLLHNLVVQRKRDGAIERIVVIDGLGNPGLLPEALLPGRLRQAKARRKTANLVERIGQLLAQRGADTFPGYHGLLIHDGTEQGPERGKT